MAINLVTLQLNYRIMLNILLITIMCYQLHRFAKERGLKPWSFVLNYFGACLLVIFLLSYTFLTIYGQESLTTDEGRRNALWFEPIALMFEIFLYLYFRKRIQKTVATSHDDEDPPPTPPTTSEKKNLSYFR